MHGTATSALGGTSDDRFDHEVLGADAPVLNRRTLDRQDAGGGAARTGRTRAARHHGRQPASDESGPVPQWAPGDACTLPTAQQPLREAEFAALFATALRGVQRPSPTWLRLELDPRDEAETTMRDLTARESACCAFFDFQLTTTDSTLILDVRVPAARIDVLDGLARHARATAQAGPETVA